ncbi:threonine-phosphate decarboxylase CobD [Phaeobacter sp.]|uniref:threonine-phosphate decarboxylase CobD n=1 Tax=Phaeobacter sp. TaxID=1902409 RepID=UPI0025FA24B5|nr:threonine-phosphate decarboxylase CobD [Phaeobacter sp.]
MTGTSELKPLPKRDHGGNLSAAAAQYGGALDQWMDLSTGINPTPYPVGTITAADWGALPDDAARQDLIEAARDFWSVPASAAILPAPGASALIAAIPALAEPRWVEITTPTYNEHAAAFTNHNWQITARGPAEARVLVHPNNPDGRLWSAHDAAFSPLVIIDESFCDVCPDQSLIEMARRPGVIVLKSFGKFWGLAGLRLGFAIGDPALIEELGRMQGPWAVSGPGLRIGTRALRDKTWANETRRSLHAAAQRLDQLMTAHKADLVGGTDLFRLYEVDNAEDWQKRLAHSQIWSRIFPYSKTLLRLGLPADQDWERLENAL